MSTEQNPADIDPETFDLDGWIDGVVRPETTVPLYVNDREYAEQVARIEALIPLAEKTKPEDRGLDDPSPESLAAELADLRAAREATAVKVRVRQLTRTEQRELLAAGGDDPLDTTLHILAAAIVEPAFTPAQLRRLYERDQSGEAMVDQITGAVLALGNGLPVPS